MELNTNQEEIEYKKKAAYEKAYKRVKEIKTFYIHLLVYCIVSPFIVFINYITYWDYKWFWFSVVGWGLGVTIHGVTVFAQNVYLGKEWEDRKMKEFLEKEQAKRNQYE